MGARRPNFFLSTRLDAEDVQIGFRNFFDHVMENNPRYSNQLIQPEQIHITLFVMHLADHEAINRARQCLVTSAEMMKTFYPDEPPSLKFKGIGTFGQGRVVFAPPCPGPNLDHFGDLTRALRSRFQDAGILDTAEENNEFVAHATLMKFRARDGRKEKVPKEVVERFQEFEFGSQNLQAIELSAMMMPKLDGYYRCMGRVPF